MLNALIIERQAAQAKPETINHSLCVLHRAFYLGLRAGTVDKLPYFPMLKFKNVREGFFSREQFERIRAALPEELRLLATLGYS